MGAWCGCVIGEVCDKGPVTQVRKTGGTDGKGEVIRGKRGDTRRVTVIRGGEMTCTRIEATIRGRKRGVMGAVAEHIWVGTRAWLRMGLSPNGSCLTPRRLGSSQ